MPFWHWYAKGLDTRVVFCPKRLTGLPLKPLQMRMGFSAVVLDGLNEVSKSNSQLSTLNSNYRGLER